MNKRKEKGNMKVIHKDAMQNEIMHNNKKKRNTQLIENQEEIKQEYIGLMIY